MTKEEFEKLLSGSMLNNPENKPIYVWARGSIMTGEEFREWFEKVCQYQAKDIIWCDTPYKVDKILELFGSKHEWRFPVGAYYSPTSDVLLDKLIITAPYNILIADQVLTGHPPHAAK